MKLNILTTSIQDKLSYINHAVSPKTQIPILQNILLTAAKNNLVIRSTDLEIGIEVSVAAKTEEEGSVTVPARTFIELINTIPDETIDLETDKDTLLVKSKKTKSIFQTTKSDDFPILYKEKGKKVSTLNAENVKKDLNKLIYAAAADTTRPALSGIMVKNEEKGFLFVSTDGYRLSLKHHSSGEGDSKKTDSYIVPAKVFKELISIKEEDEHIEVYISEENSQIIFTQGETVLVGRLIEGTFPSYEKIIPSDFSTQSVFDREELLKAVKICSIFARDSANIIKLAFEKNKITISSQSSQIGENTVVVEAELKGEENEIAFNARYLLEMLSSIPEEEMVFEMTGPLNPGVFKIKEDASFLHLIMPVRVQG
jgi:DNA polymerase III subunit beta